MEIKGKFKWGENPAVKTITETLEWGLCTDVTEAGLYTVSYGDGKTKLRYFSGNLTLEESLKNLPKGKYKYEDFDTQKAALTKGVWYRTFVSYNKAENRSERSVQLIPIPKYYLLHRITGPIDEVSNG